MRSAPFLSVLSPVYDEQESVSLLAEELKTVLQQLERDGKISGYEIIFIDDGSNDGTSEVLRRLYREAPSIGIVRFRTNMGKSAALSHGFKACNGDVIVTIDGDLQDDPAEIPELLETLQQGFHVVSGWKAERKDPISKTLPSRLYNWVTRMASGLPLHDFNCGLKIYQREVLEEIRVYGQLHRFLPVLAHWRGFSIGERKVHHRPRRYGRSKYGLSRFAAGLLDFLTVLFLMRYRRQPLHLFGLVGLLLFAIGMGINIYLALVWIQTQSIGGRPLLIFGLLSTILGFQFISIGLLGEMMVHMFKGKEDSPVEYELVRKRGIS
jgi:glycosyltransferase involved in cell wall biosynthesis